MTDKDSILNFYRQLIKIRKNSVALRHGSWKTLIHYPYEHLAYTRQANNEKILIIINFSYEKEFTVDEDVEPENWEVLISNILAAGKIIDLPKTLQAFEITILRRT